MTLLIGEEGAGKSTLLRSGVLPIMNRRARNLAHATMAAQRIEAAGAMPSPDRRSVPADSRYAPVFFDRWDDAPLASLRAVIEDAAKQVAAKPVEPSLSLADALIASSQNGSVRFLIILDGFEAFLATPESSATREFTDQLVGALNTPFLPANFLISIRDDAEPLLEPLAQRVPGLGDARLRVLPLRRAPERSAWGDPATRPVDHGESLISMAYNTPAVDFDITTASVESTMSVEAEPAATLGATTDANDAPPSGRLGDLLAQPEFDPADVTRHMQAAAPRRRWPWLIAACAAGVLLLVVVTNRPDGGSSDQPSKPPGTAARDAGPASSAPAASGEAAAPSPVPPLASSADSASPAASSAAPTPTIEPPVASGPIPAPQTAPAPAVIADKNNFTLAVDGEDSTATRIANELAKAVARDGFIVDVRATNDPSAQLVTERRGEPQLIIARRNVIEAARKSNVEAMTTQAARMLMPLFTEELYFIVRVDSPMAYVHQIENKRINIGASNGARAGTARSVYQAMFGKAIPAAAAGALDVRHALDALTRDGSIDAIVLVAAHPAAFLTGMSQPMRQRIKLLKLDAGNPAERRAMRTYLSATLREDANRVLPYQNIQTLAVTSFLLASPPADPAAAERLEAFANSLCRSLPALKRAGDPHWREVGTGSALNIDWPDAGAAAVSLRTCGKRKVVEPRRKRTNRRR